MSEIRRFLDFLAAPQHRGAVAQLLRRTADFFATRPGAWTQNDFFEAAGDGTTMPWSEVVATYAAGPLEPGEDFHCCALGGALYLERTGAEQLFREATAEDGDLPLDPKDWPYGASGFEETLEGLRKHARELGTNPPPEPSAADTLTALAVAFGIYVRFFFKPTFCTKFSPVKDFEITSRWDWVTPGHFISVGYCYNDRLDTSTGALEITESLINCATWVEALRPENVADIEAAMRADLEGVWSELEILRDEEATL